MAIKDYSTEPDMNTTISGINIAEGCAPSGINNAIRQLMADVKAEKDARDASASAQSSRDAAQDAAISASQSSADEQVSALRGLIATEKAALQGQIREAVPAGTVIAFAANSVPEGFLLCNGAVVSRTTYADLFATIGTTYGAGDGSTTFNLPDLQGRMIQGEWSHSPVGTYKEAAIPNIYGQLNGIIGYTNGIETTDAFYHALHVQGAVSIGNSGATGNYIAFNASRVSSVYQDGCATVQPPALTMRYYIKY